MTETQNLAMETEETLEPEVSDRFEPPPPPEFPSGKVILEYLHQTEHGAPMTDILQYLCNEYKKDSNDISSVLQSVLEKGTALGFLEKKGSNFLDCTPRVRGLLRSPRRRRRRLGCGCPQRKRKTRRRRRSCRQRKKRRSRRCCCRRR